jgi:flagellar biosynthesis/type III secretory pathway M-ring protein FliF/YscJ
MVTELLVVWIVGVVAFFVLWAILAKIIKRISEKKEHKEAALRQAQGPEESETEETNL